jgi:hypothetical protein
MLNMTEASSMDNDYLSTINMMHSLPAGGFNLISPMHGFYYVYHVPDIVVVQWISEYFPLDLPLPPLLN